MVDFASAYLGIIKEFNWRYVVVLLQDENLYTLVIIIIMTCNEKKRPFSEDGSMNAQTNWLSAK